MKNFSFSSLGQIFLISCVGVCVAGCLRTRSDLNQSSNHQVKPVATKEQRRAQSEVRFQEVDEQMREFSGRVEAMETSLGQLRESKVEEQNLGEQSAGALQNRLVLYEQALLKLEKRVEKLEANTSTRSKTKKKKKKGAFTLGEERFGKKDWSGAALNYQKYREAYPKGKYYAEATYKIGVCFQEMGKKSDAKLFYNEVIQGFPKSREAKKAKFRLKNLK